MVRKDLPPAGITLREDVSRTLIWLLGGGLCAMSALAQSPAGSQADWDLRPRIEKFARNAGMLKPILDQIQPAKWTVEGGSDAYQKQQKSCADSLGYVQNALARWSAQPDKLSLMMETLVRSESLSQQAISLSGGVRRYQNPALAELLDAQLQIVEGDLEWLRGLSLDLAVQREKELDVAQREAQRCRVQILQSRPGKN
jgi:hypothetical protein